MKQNIRVNRYSPQELPEGAACPEHGFAWEASIEPEDRSWVLFVPLASRPDMQAQLWHRIGTRESDKELGEEGEEQDLYALEGSPEHEAFKSAR